MKKLFYPLLVAGLLISHSAFTQTISCADFSITGIHLSPWDSSQYIVSIQFHGTNSDFINYPHISSVIDADGDTIASGRLEFFGQIGGSVQDYRITPVGDMDTTQFTAVFIYNMVDTCHLSFARTTISVEPEELKETVEIWPNPIVSSLNVKAEAALIGSTYNIYNSRGKRVLSGRMNSQNSTIDLDKFEPGIYFFNFSDNLKQTFKLIKE